MNPFRFQRSCPSDVALFVEPCFQFHQHRHLLVVETGFEQCFDHGRVPPDAVQRLLNCQHIGVMRGGFEKFHDRHERVVRVMKENVFAADGGENVAVVVSSI